MLNSKSSFSRLLSVLLVATAASAWLQSASAQSIADNVRPVSQVCLAGQPCVGSAASTGNAAPVAATAAVEEIVEVVEEVAEEVVDAVADAATETVASVAADTGFDVAAKYQQSCFACHGTGAAGAPKLDDTAEWETRMAQGMETVMANVVDGLNAMPPKGLCMDCSDSDLVALVEYMSSQ